MVAVAVGLVLLTLLVLWWRSRIIGRSPAREAVIGSECSSSALAESQQADFRAVRIDFTDSEPPCRTATELAHQRFLLAEAPMLPLPDCDSGACRCAYVRSQDRRYTDRRAKHDMHEAICQNDGISNRRDMRNRRLP